jgi:hypothetical protein
MDAGDHGVSGEKHSRPWLDILERKHECGASLADYRDLEVTHAGRPVRVSVPDTLDHPERLEIRATLASENLLVLIGHYATKPDDPYERGILMVARRQEDDSYVVHVWHEVYPWALEKLGLDELKSV